MEAEEWVPFWFGCASLLARALHLQVEGDLITCNSLLSAFSTAALWPTAVRRLREAERSGTRPNIISCNLLAEKVVLWSQTKGKEFGPVVMVNLHDWQKVPECGG